MQVTEHKVKLTGLEPRTRYYYSIGSRQDTLQNGPDNYFVTLPLPGAESLYRIAAVGDCGNNSINQRSVRDQLTRYLGNNYLDAWILLGDNSYTYGRDAEFQSNFFNIYKDTLLKKYPLFPAPGNHDYNDDKTAQDTHDIAYYQIFSMPVNGEAGGLASHNPAFYSFDLGNIHFLSLDSYGREDSQKMYDTAGAQVQWIKKDLEANKNKGWVIAYWHHPPYTMGSHNSDKEQDLVQIRQNFIQILERYGVDLVLCGHSHDYERSKLMQGHFGLEASFNPAMNLVSSSSGLYDGSPNSCPYLKDSADGYRGTVYVVSGSAGQLGGKQTSFPHEALPYSDATHGGAGMLEIEGNRLDWKWVCADGVIRDHFTMIKHKRQRQVLTIKKGESLTLTATFAGEYKWTAGGSTRQISQDRSLTVHPTSTTVYTVTDKFNCLKDVWEVKVSR
jgi:3',5'-cyclic AMP phosphodiesterase CpdA